LAISGPPEPRGAREPGGIGAFALLSGARWFPVGLGLSVLVLIMQSRGLSVAAVGLVVGAYSINTLALELPTGALGDAWSRKRVVVLGALTEMCAFLLLAVAPGLALMLVAALLLGAGSALVTGPLPAWFVDATLATDADTDLRPGLARGQAAETLALAAGIGVGGLLPGLVGDRWLGLPSGGDTLLVSLSVPLLLAAAAELLFAVLVVVLMTGPDHRKESTGSVPRAMRAAVSDAVRLSRRSRVVRLLLVGVVAVGFVLSGMELLIPGELSAIRGDPESGAAAYGLLAAVGFLLGAGAALASPAVARRVWSGSPAKLVAAGALAGAFGVAVLLLGGLGAVAGGYVWVYTLLAFIGPLTADLLHRQADASIRSTVLSIESMAIGIGGITGSVALGLLSSAFGTGAGFTVMAVALLIAAAAYARISVAAR